MFKVGGYCMRKMSAEEAQARVDLDQVKAKKEGCKDFHGNASAYMHTNQAYRIKEILSNGGVRLEGFVLTVSQKDLLPADPNQERGPGLRWGR